MPPALCATPHADLPPPSLFMPSTLSFCPPATLLPVCPPSLTPQPSSWPSPQCVTTVVGPASTCTCLYQRHPPISRCITAVMQLSPTTLNMPLSLKQPPTSTRTHPCTHHYHPWGGMVVGQDGEGGCRGKDAYILALHSPSSPNLSGSHPSPSPSTCHCHHHATATHCPPVPTGVTRHSPMPQPHTVHPPTVRPPVIVPYHLR